MSEATERTAREMIAQEVSNTLHALGLLQAAAAELSPSAEAAEVCLFVVLMCVYKLHSIHLHFIASLYNFSLSVYIDYFPMTRG